MATTTLLLDSCPPYLASPRAPASLLLTPLGGGMVLEYVRAQLSATEAQALAVVPAVPRDEQYTAALQALHPDLTILTAASLPDFLAAQEPSDWLLLIDVRFLPLGRFELHRLALTAGDREPARHLVHRRRNGDGPQERLLLDEHQRVRAIQRLYEGVTNVETEGVSCSLVSVAAIEHLRHCDLGSLARLRTRLAAGGVPGRDLMAAGRVLDLTRPEELLALNARVTLAAASSPSPPPFVELASGIWAGPGCQIHPTSRLYGPVILHANATVGAEAVVAGPAVLGPGACVEPQAVVSQCLVTAGVCVPTGTTVAHRVLAAGAEAIPVAGDEARLRPPVLPAVWANIEDWPTPSPHALGRQSRGAKVKRVVEFSLALLGLLVLSPLLLTIAALVKLTSRGPVLFVHEREGRGGKVFRCWKFRTMADGAHLQQRALYERNTVDGPQFKLPDDPRLTWFGRWLRLTNSDELPQLYNVLRGEMSLIGPRPSPFRENQICVPWRNARLSVRPGITGLWQVCRHERLAGDFHQWIYFDLLYVRHWSLSLDLRILLATLLTLAGRWSVPLNWMIPRHKRQPEARFRESFGHGWPVLRRPGMGAGEAQWPAVPAGAR